MRVRRAATLLALAALCGPAAAGSLPLSGVHGDAMGCERLVRAPDAVDEPGGINLYPDRLVGYEWSCTFAEVWVHPDLERTYAVQGICSGEGLPFLEQYILQLGRDAGEPLRVMDATGATRWELSACADTGR